MSDFDLAAFRKAKFQPREEDVPLAALTAAGFAGYEGDGEAEKPIPVVFKVRGLTAEELARADQEADNSKALAKLLEKLAGNDTEKIEALLKAMGLSQGTELPPAMAKKLAHIEFAVTEPKLKRDDVVKIARAFPTDFLELSNRIYSLTGKGMTAQVKRRPSGKTQASRQA